MVLTNPPFTLFLGWGQDSVSQGISLLIIGCGVQGGPGTMNMCVYVYVFMFLNVWFFFFFFFFFFGGAPPRGGGAAPALQITIITSISTSHLITKKLFFLKKNK